MFVCSTLCTESANSHHRDVWKSSHSYSHASAVNESTGLYGAHNQSTYSIARSLSECCEDRCTSLPHNVITSCGEIQANTNSTPVCLSNTRSAKHSEKQKLPVALMAATQSSLMLRTLTLQSPCEPRAGHHVSDARVSEMHTNLPSSTVTVCYHLFDAI